MNNLAEQIARKFARDTERHVMLIHRDQKPYRHLRMAQPGSDSWVHQYEIMTFPNVLVCRGDMGTFVFEKPRTADMLAAFAGCEGHAYWATKCTAAGEGGITEYSADRAKGWVLEHTKGWFDGLTLDDAAHLSKELRWVLDQVDEGEDLFRERLREFYVVTDGRAFQFEDVAELHVRKYTYHYLWVYYAIVLASTKYYQLQEGQHEDE
jgi:hypothetical protein